MNYYTSNTSPQTHYQHRIFIDIPLLILIMLLMCVSLTVLYSASGFDKMYNQSIRFGIGILAMFCIALIPMSVIRFFSPFVYIATIALLLGVYFFGISVNGAKRWFSIGITQIQPSEIAKLSVPLMLAFYFYAKTLPPKWIDLFVSLLIISIPVGLVFKQPDLGTSILVATSGIALIFLTGISWKLIISSLVLVIAAGPVFWHSHMKDYQKERVITFLNPESNPTGSGYNIIQSKIAIGSGGLDGKGFQQGVQSNEFLPERTTDFIFAVFAEEFGFWGFIFLAMLYFLILLRGFWLSIKMTDNFSRLLSGALITIFFVYFFINIGMVSGILPVVGLPLPLMSYGGTSIMSLMIAFGLIMNLYGNRRIEEKRGMF